MTTSTSSRDARIRLLAIEAAFYSREMAKGALGLCDAAGAPPETRWRLELIIERVNVLAAAIAQEASGGR